MTSIRYNKAKGSIMSDETKEKVRQHRLGKKHTEETKQKISAAMKGKNNPFYGKEHTIETKQKMSEAKKGKYDKENNPMYDKKHTIETRERMSQNRIGKHTGKDNHFYGKTHTDEVKEKLKNINRNKKLSDETREKISIKFSGINNPFYGKFHSEETKYKMKLSHEGTNCGKDNPNWRGGISTEPYCFAWSFKEFKQMIKDRDNNMCQSPMCNRKSSKLVVHHIDYNKKGCDPSNLITLCNSCNVKANFNRNNWQIIYNNLMIYKSKV